MNRSALITGISGFVGRHLAMRLHRCGYEVHGFTRSVSDRSLDFPDEIPVYLGDITDTQRLLDVYEETQPDVVIHLAAQSSVEYSFAHPAEVCNVNFNGVVNAARMAMRGVSDLDRFIFASSVEVYGSQERSPLHESLAPRPASPYGVAKTAAEHYIDYLHRAYDFPALTLRNTNTYGRRYSHRFVVEHIVKNMVEDVAVLEMGNPYPIRDFQYIEDEVDAYVRAAESDEDVLGEILNTGTGRGITIRELVDTIAQRTGWDGDVSWNSNSSRPLEIDSLVVDNGKIAELLGWSPSYSLEEGLDETIRFWEEQVV